jgi:hypothetical protein
MSGVKGRLDTPGNTKRTGSFPLGHYPNFCGDLVDDHATPARLAFEARGQDETLPRKKMAAKPLADRGTKLLQRDRKSNARNRCALVRISRPPSTSRINAQPFDCLVAALLTSRMSEASSAGVATLEYATRPDLAVAKRESRSSIKLIVWLIAGVHAFASLGFAVMIALVWYLVAYPGRTEVRLDSAVLMTAVLGLPMIWLAASAYRLFTLRGRALAVITSVFMLVLFPIGTALGVLSLIALGSERCQYLFRTRTAS